MFLVRSHGFWILEIAGAIRFWLILPFLLPSYNTTERLGWPDSSADSVICLPLRARCTAQPLVGILIFFPKNTNLFTRLCLGLTDRQAILVRSATWLFK